MEAVVSGSGLNDLVLYTSIALDSASATDTRDSLPPLLNSTLPFKRQLDILLLQIATFINLLLTDLCISEPVLLDTSTPSCPILPYDKSVNVTI